MKGILKILRLRKILVDMLFPAFCVGCRREGVYLCDQCTVFVSDAAFVCPQCNQASVVGRVHPACARRYGLDGAVNIWQYEGVVKRLLHMIKYENTARAIDDLVWRAVAAIAEDYLRYRDFLTVLEEPQTAISFVPLHPKKHRKRGYNQAAVMAERLAAAFGKPAPAAMLSKTVETTSQTELSAVERRTNVNGAFAVTDTILPKSVVLVDDMRTTGSTLQECSKTLKRAGAETVWAITLARTP